MLELKWLGVFVHAHEGAAGEDERRWDGTGRAEGGRQGFSGHQPRLRAGAVLLPLCRMRQAGAVRRSQHRPAD
eukprot:8724838-Pyramimonas_sp.AAC.1